MLELGKRESLRIAEYLKIGDKIQLGEFLCTVRRDTRGFYLNVNKHYNDVMFDFLGMSARKYCTKNGIEECSGGGIFPFMDLENIRKCLRCLMRDYKEKGLQAEVMFLNRKNYD